MLLRGAPDTQRSAIAAAGQWRQDRPPVIYLAGELGSGKSTWARAYIQALGWTGSVPSPSYTIMEHYPLAQGTVIHVDLYRITHPAAVGPLGLHELCGEATVILEWPSRGRGMLPRPDLLLRLAWREQGRIMRCRAFSQTGERVLVAMEATHQGSAELGTAGVSAQTPSQASNLPAACGISPSSQYTSRPSCESP